MNNFYVYSFYRFKNLKNKKAIKLKLDKYISDKVIRGTILIANEGINGSISGDKDDLIDVIKFIKKLLCIKKLELKINSTDFLPFNKIKIRLKKEIVSLGRGIVNVSYRTNKFIDPMHWDNFIKQKNIRLIDLRNTYEIDIGKFKNATNPNTKNFREFPNEFKKMKISKNDTVATYCTGGIRCEKAAGYLYQKGYKNVYQLKGGIINYLSHFRDKKIKLQWNGECFVFDKRVTINKKLKKGKYEQCYGCRHPLSKTDMESNKYQKGVQCPFCYKLRTATQKKNSKTRQSQIESAERKKVEHKFMKISNL